MGGGGKVAVMAAGAAGAILQHMWVQSMSWRLSHNKPTARSAPEPHLYGTFFSSSVSSARWQKGCGAEAGRHGSGEGEGSSSQWLAAAQAL